MKAVVWTGVDSVEIREMPVPETDEVRDTLVRVRYNGICGSDLTIIHGKHPRAKAPLVLGHEFMGTVEHAPKGSNLTSGQRVAVEPLLACGHCAQCRSGNHHVCENLRLIGVEATGACAEYVTVPHQKAYAVPEGVSDEEAALSEPLAVAVHAASLAGLSSDDSVSVIGAGPIGLLVAEVARAYHARQVMVSELDPERLSRAKSMGFETIDAANTDVVSEILKKTGGKGTNVTFDAAGVPPVCNQLIPVTAIRGRIVMVSIHKTPCDILFQQLSYKENMIQGVRIYAAGDFRTALDLMAEGTVNVKPLITHCFSMEDAAKAYKAATPGHNSCKVLVKPGS